MTRYRSGNRRGYTLVELVVGMGSATFLLGGLASTIFIASRAMDSDASAPVQTAEAAETAGDLMADLQHATSFSERTSNAVTFTVPDRDGDELSETIRYAWSGTAGDPLLVRINGGTAAPAADNVEQLTLGYLLRSVAGTGFAKGVFEEDGPNGPVAHWKLDETSGLEALDSTTNENHGELINGPVWIPVQMVHLGRGLQFDGQDDYVNVAHNDVLSITDELTITAWVLGASGGFSGWHVIINKGTGYNVHNYFLAINDSQLGFGFCNNGWHDFYSTVTIPTGTWHHLAATVELSGDERIIRLYIDGAEVFDETTDETLEANSDALVIGTNQFGAQWHGILSDIRIYSRALSADEITQVKNERIIVLEPIPRPRPMPIQPW